MAAETGLAKAGIPFGRYELTTPLGAGGMAEIFLARATGFGGFERRLVIKRVLPGLAADPDFVAMFVDEARIMGHLHHDNVVQVYDFGLIDGQPFLALEYLDGLPLHRILSTFRREDRPFPVAVAAYIAREICRALDYVHGARSPDGHPLGIVHRDVTPTNIMLTPSGSVKLLDFGVAKAAHASHLTRTGVVKGKAGYLAPEQARAQPVDGRTDIFAVGIILWEMLCGQRLFAADNDLATSHLIVEKPIPPPSELRPEVPAALDAIVLRALARPKQERYQDAGAMARELDEIVMTSRFRVEQAAAVVHEADEAGRTPPPQPVPATPTDAAVTHSGPTKSDPVARVPPRSSTEVIERSPPKRGLAIGIAGAMILALVILVAVRGLRHTDGTGGVVPDVPTPDKATAAAPAAAQPPPPLQPEKVPEPAHEAALAPSPAPTPAAVAPARRNAPARRKGPPKNGSPRPKPGKIKILEEN